MSENKKSKYYEPADIVIYVKDRGIVLREKSLIAIDKDKCKTIAAREMFKGLLQKAQIKTKGIQRPKRIAVKVPKGMSEVELKAYEDLFCSIFLINIPLSSYQRDFTHYVPPVYFGVTEMNEFIEMTADKYKVIVGITKDNPTAYIKEQLKSTLEYSKEVGINKEDILQMLQKEINI